MFDIGFTEMMFIAVVALIVIGPERLPKVARTLGRLIGRAQRYVADVKSEIDREIKVEELRKLQGEMHSAAREFKGQVESSMAEAQGAVNRETNLLKAEYDSLKSEKTEETGVSETPPAGGSPSSEAESGAGKPASRS